jgi:hypothetical protein
MTQKMEPLRKSNQKHGQKIEKRRRRRPVSRFKPPHRRHHGSQLSRPPRHTVESGLAVALKKRNTRWSDPGWRVASI